MKSLSLVFGLIGVLGAGMLAGCHGDAAEPSGWRIIWFPPNDTMKSWDWVEESGRNWNTMKVFPTSYAQKFPDEVKRWELGVVSAKAPEKAVALPLTNPHSGNTISFEWMPGEFHAGVDRLDAMGEGTFLCAILGDGKRYSNVARVTIRHDYALGREPVIRLVAVQPYGKDDPVKYIGAWIVAPAPTDAKLDTIAAGCPAWEVNGVWHAAPGDRNGAVYPLPSGVSWGEVYDVGYRADSATESFRGFEPPMPPFTKAKVRLRIADQTSGVFNIEADGDAMDRFDEAFKAARP